MRIVQCPRKRQIMVIKTKIRPTFLKEVNTRNTVITVIMMVILRWSASERQENPNYREFKPKGANGEARNVEIFLADVEHAEELVE